VGRAAILLGHQISRRRHCALRLISVKRSGTTYKRFLSPLLRQTPRIVRNALRQLELRSRYHNVSSARSIVMDSGLATDRKWLLVDDAVDTGNTLRAIMEFLRRRHGAALQLRSAVITVTSSRPVMIPDFALHRGLVCRFPWSSDSTELPQFEEEYSKIMGTVAGSNA